MRNSVGTVQTVLVLGGSSDIGRAIARRLVADGARTVVLAGRRPQTYGDSEAELRAAGATRVVSVHFDAEDIDSHPAVLAEVLCEVGDLDVTVLAFGVLGDQSIDEHDAASAVSVARINYLGAVSMLTLLGDRLSEQGHGAIVVLSSVAGERVRRSNYVYGSTKAGLDTFAAGLADALHGSGSRVLVVRPGFVTTKMTEGLPAVPLSTTPTAVADTVARGLRGSATVVWVPSALRPVMSVLRHVPRSLFRLLPL